VTEQQHFWDLFYAWSLALGFVLTVILTGFIWASVYQGNFTNPLAPLIRAAEARRVHRQKMELIRLKAQLARDGLDPAYVAFLEKEMAGEENSER
jgi:hypothetical protein